MRDIQEILRLHKLWRNGDPKGVRADLTGADLTGADLYKADLSYVNLFRADLYKADLFRADLFRADLSYANLSYANLAYANLAYANLAYANLTYANLAGANLTYANLAGANLDCSSMPLWCGDLKANYDDKQVIQQLYHVLSHAKNSKNVSKKLREELMKLSSIANKFHRIPEVPEL